MREIAFIKQCIIKADHYPTDTIAEYRDGEYRHYPNNHKGAAKNISQGVHFPSQKKGGCVMAHVS